MKNGQGGILGRPIELYVEDYGTEPAKAPAAARRLAQQKNVDMILRNNIEFNSERCQTPNHRP